MYSSTRSVGIGPYSADSSASICWAVRVPSKVQRFVGVLFAASPLASITQKARRRDPRMPGYSWANLELRMTKGRYDVAVYAKNLFDKRAFNTGGPFTANTAGPNTPVPPGVRLTSFHRCFYTAARGRTECYDDLLV